MLQYWFVTDDEGLVHAHVADLSSLQMALEDALAPEPPTINGRLGPRTYWVDHALRQMFEVPTPDQAHVIASGNITYLEVRDEYVYADVDYEADTGLGDLVSRADLLDLLVAYRRAIEAAPQLPLLRDPAGVIRNGFPAQTDN